MFKLAHISDPHLGPLPAASLRQLSSKRVLGWANWKRDRHKVHDMATLLAITNHIKDARPDHVAITGDLVNIALPAEFIAAKKWLEGLGHPQDISLVPGNHDAYIKTPFEKGIGLWAPFMGAVNGKTDFPFLTEVGPLAIIGLSSSIPSLPFRATGEVTKAHYKKAAELLDAAKDKGLIRVILIHHPPLRGLSPRHKRLLRAKRFETLLQNHGAELVLHGHLHKTMINRAAGKDGMVPVVGVASASCSGLGKREPASWHQYEFGKTQEGHTITLVRFEALCAPDGSWQVKEAERKRLVG